MKILIFHFHFPYEFRSAIFSGDREKTQDKLRKIRTPFWGPELRKMGTHFPEFSGVFSGNIFRKIDRI